MTALIFIAAIYAAISVGVCFGLPPIALLLALPPSVSIAGLIFGRDVYEGYPQ